MLVDFKNQLKFQTKILCLSENFRKFHQIVQKLKPTFCTLLLFEAKTQYLRFVKSPKKLCCISTYNLCSVGSPNPSFVNTKNREITLDSTAVSIFVVILV